MVSFQSRSYHIFLYVIYDQSLLSRHDVLTILDSQVVFAVALVLGVPNNGMVFYLLTIFQTISIALHIFLARFPILPFQRHFQQVNPLCLALRYGLGYILKGLVGAIITCKSFCDNFLQRQVTPVLLVQEKLQSRVLQIGMMMFISYLLQAIRYSYELFTSFTHLY